MSREVNKNTSHFKNFLISVQINWSFMEWLCNPKKFKLLQIYIKIP